jgi:hypothetical protein
MLTWKTPQGILAFVCFGAMFLTCLAADWTGKQWVWLANLALAVLFVVFVGLAITGDWRGALIDDRNTLSLARFQIALWTILIGSAYVTAATTNALAGEDLAGPTRQQLAEAQQDVAAAQLNLTRAEAKLQAGGGAARLSELAKQVEALREELARQQKIAKDLEASRRPGSAVVAIPAAVWMLLGISLTSLAGSPLILSYKRESAPSPAEHQATIAALQQQRVDTAALTNEGLVVAKTSIHAAAFSDLFRGEEVGNADHVDLGRVQLFFFTVGVLVAYAIALGARFRLLGPIHEFPDLDTSLATLLGASNAGYLLNKAVPHSQTA